MTKLAFGILFILICVPLFFTACTKKPADNANKTISTISTEDVSIAPPEPNAVVNKTSDTIALISTNENEFAPAPYNFDLSKDAFIFQGMNLRYLKRIVPEDLIEIYEKADSDKITSDYMRLKNGVYFEFDNNDYVRVVATFYDSDDHNATMLGIDNTYTAKMIIDKYGKPYSDSYDSPDPLVTGEDFGYAVNSGTYIKFSFEKKTGYVNQISCFYGPPATILPE